jgi:hypothetical protein
MEIKSVVVKTVVVVNGQEHVIWTCDWTENIQEANKEGCGITTIDDVVEYVKSES